MACSGYPDCRNTRELARDGNGAANSTNGIEAINEVCENCGRPMTLKRGRFGQFLACTGYPECRTTRKIVGTQQASAGRPDVPLTEECPQCGKNLVIKHGRYGEFTACSNYPNCKYVKKKTLGISCPKPGCKGELVEKRSRRGKIFFGCDQFPNCDYTVWNKPVARTCPQCGSPYLLEKTTKKQGTVQFCNSESCEYKESIELVEEPTTV
jgi:DNA topoisomerase-1